MDYCKACMLHNYITSIQLWHTPWIIAHDINDMSPSGLTHSSPLTSWDHPIGRIASPRGEARWSSVKLYIPMGLSSLVANKVIFPRHQWWHMGHIRWYSRTCIISPCVKIPIWSDETHEWNPMFCWQLSPLTILIQIEPYLPMLGWLYCLKYVPNDLIWPTKRWPNPFLNQGVVWVIFLWIKGVHWDTFTSLYLRVLGTLSYYLSNTFPWYSHYTIYDFP